MTNHGNWKHGRTGSKEYKAWIDIKRLRKGNVCCDRWRKSFAKFISDVGHPSSCSQVLGRFNSSLPFSPVNCKWMSLQERREFTESAKVIQDD